MKDKLNQLAIPLMLNNVVALLIGLCDQAMIGHVSMEGFASVGIVAGLINSCTGVLGAIAISFNILGARAKGSDDEELLEKYFQIHLVQSLLIGVVFFIFVSLFGKIILAYGYRLEGNHLKETVSYAKIFSITLGLNLLLFTGSAYLKIINKTKYILIGNLTATILNIIFDYILIFGMLGFKPLGITGNAIGSVLALLVNLLIYWIVLRRRNNPIPSKTNWSQYKTSLKLSLPLMTQELLEGTIIVLIISFLLARIGLIEVAIYQLIAIIIEITCMPMYAYSQGILTIIGETRTVSSKILYQGMKRALCCYMILVFFFIFNSHWLLKIITNDKLLYEQARLYLPWILLITTVLVPATLYKSVLQACNRERKVVLITFLAYFTGLVFAFLLNNIQLQLINIYIGTGIAYFLCLILFRRDIRFLINIK